MVKAKKRLATRKKVQNVGSNAPSFSQSLKTWEAKRSAFAQESGKARDTEQAATEDRSENGTEKAAKTKGAVVEDTIIDVIDEPVPGVARITEYETITLSSPKRGGPETDE